MHLGRGQQRGGHTCFIILVLAQLFTKPIYVVFRGNTALEVDVTPASVQHEGEVVHRCVVSIVLRFSLRHESPGSSLPLGSPRFSRILPRRREEGGRKAKVPAFADTSPRIGVRGRLRRLT